MEEFTFDTVKVRIKGVLAKHGIEVGSGVSAVTIVGLIAAGSVVSYGVILGTLAVGPVAYLLYSLREHAPGVYNWILKHPLVTVLILTIGSTGLFGTTATGLIASAVFGILKILMIGIFNKYLGPAEEAPDKTLLHYIKSSFNFKKSAQQPKVKPEEIYETTCKAC